MASGTNLFALFILLTGVATTSPLPSGNLRDPGCHDRQGQTSSPRILCTTWNGRKACEKFAVPIVYRSSIRQPALNSFSSVVVGSGRLISEEHRQTSRIMDMEDAPDVIDRNNSLFTPDIQVVLWFILLCCLAEGVVSGFRWLVVTRNRCQGSRANLCRWRRPERGQGELEKTRERQEIGRLGSFAESDEDDEANIPVL